MVMLCKEISKEHLPLWLAVNKKDWVAEEKYDGDRVRLRIRDGVLNLYNRAGNDITSRYPEIHNIGIQYDCLIDGEMCVLDKKGVSQFNEGIAFRTHCTNPDSIKAAMKEYPVTFVAFDLCELHNKCIRHLSFLTRKRKLINILYFVNSSYIMYSHHFKDIKDTWDTVVAKSGEGIVIKNLKSKYEEGRRSQSWLKVKDVKEKDMWFTKYEVHPKGLTVTSECGLVRMAVNGSQHYAVKLEIDRKGRCLIGVRYLGETKAGKLRQPTCGGQK